MGLDMYLYVAKYESKAQWNSVDNAFPLNFYPKELESLAKQHWEDNFLSKETKYQIGYWRKANAIHKWFVDKLASGVDNCQEIYVGMEDLKTLLGNVEMVLENKDRAKDLLPTQEGFFFGGLEFDDWYFEDLKYTKELLTRVIKFLSKHKDYRCYYKASW